MARAKRGTRNQSEPGVAGGPGRRWAALVGATRSAALGVVCGLAAATGWLGCAETGESDARHEEHPDAAPSVASADGPRGTPFVQPPPRPFDSNPFDLVASAPALAPGAEVYAVPERMLGGAKEGSSLALRLAAVERVEGGNIVVRMGREPPYPIHPAYVLVAPVGPVRRGSAVLAPFRGSLAHGVVTGLKRDLVTVRFVDAGPGYGDNTLRRDEVSPQTAGLRPGNYAVMADGQRFEHVLLLSVGQQAGGARRWLALGHAGAARLVDEAKLTALPLELAAKPGTTVAVPWLGTMVPAKVVAADPVGLLTVRRPRAAPAMVVGPGMVLEGAH